MDKTVQIFINKEMTEVASAISYYVSSSCSPTVFSNIFFVTLNVDGDDNYKVAAYNNNKLIEEKNINANNATSYFANLYSIIKTVGDINTTLYTYVYIQLYEEKQREILDFLVENIYESGKQYEINIYGLAYDLYSVFNDSSDNEDSNKLKEFSCQSCEHLLEYKESGKIRRILLLQDSNVKGLGINFNKEKLIRFFGEFSALATEHNADIFPPAFLTGKHFSSIGMSSIWYDEKIYVDYTSAYIIFKILVEQGVHKKGAAMIDYKCLVNENREQVSLLSKIFNQNLGSIDDLKDEDDAEKKICELCAIRYSTFEEFVLSIKNRTDLNLYEKLCLLSLLCGKTFKTSDKKVIADDANYVEKAFNEIYQWYIDRNNEIIDKGGTSIFSCPKDEEGHVYSPEQRLANLRKNIEQQEKEIEEQEKKVIQLESEARKKKKDSFEYNNVYYKLVHDIKEEPLETTFKPQKKPLDSVDLRKMFSSIRNQGSLGACSTFTLGAMFEFIINCFKGNTSSSLSPRFLYYNVSKKDASGKPIDNGSTFYDVIKKLEDVGICTEELCPYTENFENEPLPEAVEDAKTRLVTKAENVRIKHYDITSALTDGYPIAISLKLYKSFSNIVRGFVFRPSDEEIKSGDEGNHAMVICGYSEKDKVYIVRNSWGTDFGDNGYCYIPFSYIEDTDLCNMACILTGVSCNDISGFKSESDVKFDLSDESIEYAVAKISLDEEKQYVKQQKIRYIQLFRDYCKLKLELKDPEKRLQLKDQYLSIFKSKKDSNNKEDNNDVIDSGADNPKWDVYSKVCALLSLVIIPLSIYLYMDEKQDNNTKILAAVTFVIGLLLGIYSFIKWINSKNIDVKSDPMPTPISKPAVNTNELKFVVADESLRCLQNIEDKVKETYWDMLFYIQELETLYNENAINLDKVNKQLEAINIPFTFVFTKEEMINLQIDDLRLSIDVYLGMGEERSSFRKVFVDNIRTQIAEIHKDFSMIDYLNSLTDDSKAKEFINNLQDQSFPFAQHVAFVGGIKQYTVFIDAKTLVKKDNFEEFCKRTFATAPAVCYGCSPYKFICVSVNDFNKDDLKLFA